MSCTGLQDQFANGEFLNSILQFLTGCGDPTLQVLVPGALYGSVLLAMFIFGQSALMPMVVSIILAGVIFVTFPTSGVTVVLLGMMFLIAAAGQALTWRMGR
jgi:hypothetical protein